MKATSNIDDGYSGGNFGGSKAPAQTFEDPSYVQCPNCMRKFCEEAANRHIPVCAKKAKENAMKSKGNKLPPQNSTQSKFARQSSSQIGFNNSG